jgi:hypothetical protein
MQPECGAGIYRRQAQVRIRRQSMRAFLCVVALAAVVPVCAAQAMPLSADDPKFDTPQCQAARQRAMDYAQKTGDDRFLKQFAWWAAVGALAPSGTYDPTPEQKAIDRDLQRRCVTVAHRRH